MRKSHFCHFFNCIHLVLQKSGNFGVFLACFLSPEMIVNIIEDEYGLIFTFTLFGFLHFWPFLAVFWPFLVFLGFRWIFWVFWRGNEL